MSWNVYVHIDCQTFSEKKFPNNNRVIISRNNMMPILILDWFETISPEKIDEIAHQISFVSDKNNFVHKKNSSKLLISHFSSSQHT